MRLGALLEGVVITLTIATAPLSAQKPRQRSDSASLARADTVPPGATARCRDGTFSFSATHSGSCSHHGGVRAWLQVPGPSDSAQSSKNASTSVPTGATALCRDGTYSFSKHHSGTCSHHGGVARWYR
jgi:hypothetical protein